MPPHEEIPNHITAGRLYMVGPLLVVLLLLDCTTSAIFVFALASVSDAIDGYLARRWNVISEWGARWDPIADKVSTWPAFLYGLWRYGGDDQWRWYFGAALIIALYDVVVSTVIWKYRGNEILTNGWAKAKTAILMVSLVMTLIATSTSYWLPTHNWFGHLLDNTAIGLALSAAILAILSAIDYAMQWSCRKKYKKLTL